MTGRVLKIQMIIRPGIQTTGRMKMPVRTYTTVRIHTTDKAYITEEIRTMSGVLTAVSQKNITVPTELTVPEMIRYLKAGKMIYQIRAPKNHLPEKEKSRRQQV